MSDNNNKQQLDKSFNDVLSYWAVKDKKKPENPLSQSQNKTPTLTQSQQNKIQPPQQSQPQENELQHTMEITRDSINCYSTDHLLGEPDEVSQQQSQHQPQQPQPQQQPQLPTSESKYVSFFEEENTTIVGEEEEQQQQQQIQQQQQQPTTTTTETTTTSEQDQSNLYATANYYRPTSDTSSSSGYSATGVYSAAKLNSSTTSSQQDIDSSLSSYGVPVYSSTNEMVPPATSSSTSSNSGNSSNNKEGSKGSSSSLYNPYGIANYSGSDGYGQQAGAFYSSEGGSSGYGTPANEDCDTSSYNTEDEEFFISTNDNIHRVNCLPIDNTCALGSDSSEENNWNSIFQHYMDMQCSEEKYKHLSNIANEFVYSADSFGKIIISEVLLPIEKKTIKPLNLGGIAGGLKFRCQDIIFKFVVDTELIPGIWMYGETKRSDEKAQKSAGHEIKGLNHFMEISPLIRFPLMAIIDYRGYRLLAISSLPIDKKTIVYGSNDGGNTVHCSDEIVNKEMERMCKQLNLKGHIVGANKVFLYGPGDIEVHKGFDDRYYMIDFARIFPAEYPCVLNSNKKIGRDIFFSMVRPELLLKSQIPISSDAFSGWQTDKIENVKSLNDDTKRLSERLHFEIIPECIKIIESSKSKKEISGSTSPTSNNSMISSSSTSNFSISQSIKSTSYASSIGYQPSEFNSSSGYQPSVMSNEELEEVSLNFVNVGGVNKINEKDFSEKSLEVLKLIDFLHSRGVNLRYLGIISKNITDREIKNLLMTEVVARVWKKIIKSRIREKTGTGFKQIISDVFEVILSINKAKHREFWSENTIGNFKYVAQRVFPKCLSRQDRIPTVDIRSLIDTRFLAYRIINMMNIRIHHVAFAQFLTNPKYMISFKDIEDIGSVVKYPNIIDFSAGSFLYFESQRIVNEADNEANTPVEVIRWIENSQVKLRSAARSMPLSFKVLIRSSMTNMLLANISTNFKESIDICKTTLDTIRRTRSKHKGQAQLLALEGMLRIKLGNYYLFCSHSYVDYKREADQAREKLEEALAINENSIEEYLSQSIPLERFVFKKDLYETKLPFSERRRNNELFSMVLMMCESSEDSILRRVLPTIFKRIHQIRDLSIPTALTRILTSVEISNLIQQLPNLICFNIGKLTITPEISSGILAMKGLKNLKMEKFFFKNPEPNVAPVVAGQPSQLNQYIKSVLTELPGLCSLQFESRLVEDEVFNGNAHLFAKLSNLTLSDTYITDKALISLAPYLSGLTSLTLSMSRDYKDDGLIAVLESAQHLKNLSITGNSNLTDKSAEILVKYASDLQELYLVRSKYSSELIAQIVEKATKIRVLDLSSTNADISVAYSLNKHREKGLEKLYLGNTSSAGDEYIELLINGLSSTNLKVLHLPQTSECSDEILWRLFSKLEQIQELKVPDRFYLLSFMEWFSTNNNMINDYVSEIAVSASSMPTIISEQPIYNLKSLDLTLSTVSLSSLQELFTLTPQLESLSLSAVTFVNDQSIVIEWNEDLMFQLVPLFLNLRDINLSNHKTIEARHIRCIISKCPAIRFVHLWNCKNITGQIIYDLSNAYPYIQFD